MQKIVILFIGAIFCSFLPGYAAQEPAKEEVAPMLVPPKMDKGVSALFNITPKMRASDYKQAFDILRREKTSAKVFFQLASGTMISNIIEMTPMDNGTLILFRFNTAQGVKLQVVTVEEIQQVSYL